MTQATPWTLTHKILARRVTNHLAKGHDLLLDTCIAIPSYARIRSDGRPEIFTIPHTKKHHSIVMEHNQYLEDLTHDHNVLITSGIRDEMFSPNTRIAQYIDQGLEEKMIQVGRRRIEDLTGLTTPNERAGLWGAVTSVTNRVRGTRAYQHMSIPDREALRYAIALRLCDRNPKLLTCDGKIIACAEKISNKRFSGYELAPNYFEHLKDIYEQLEMKEESLTVTS